MAHGNGRRSHSHKIFLTTRGNSAWQDATPDLISPLSRTWKHQVDQHKHGPGSDHCLFETILEVVSNKTTTFRFTNWDLFRANLSKRRLHSPTDLNSPCEGEKGMLLALQGGDNRCGTGQDGQWIRASVGSQGSVARKVEDSALQQDTTKENFRNKYD